MPLTREWDRRICAWLDELPRHFYRELGELELEGCAANGRLSLEEAASLAYEPMPVGAQWGAKWEYRWFRCRVVLPEAASGGRVVLRLKAGGDGLAFVNGRAAGGVDREHGEILLSSSGEAGALYEIYAEFYAGHGPIEENIGPVPPGRIVLPEPGAAQRRVEVSSFGLWDELAFGLWLDARTLYQLRGTLPESSLRTDEIDEGLRDFSLIVDFEQPLDVRRASFERGRDRLRPLLECRNGSTAPVMQVFGQSHLDLAWQWPAEETRRKAARTVSTQLALAEEYPEYRFLFCQVPLYLMVKEDYPELWGRLLAAIRSGQVLAEGGMWLEPDTNIPSGESLVRQFLYGRRFFAEELGLDTRVLWLPDSFGFSAALPQIMRSCGVPYFVTKKLVDTYDDTDPFPFTTFMWKGLDGTSVLAHVYRKCNSAIDPETFARRWSVDRVQRDGISTYLFPFGYGDGGGGPTRVMLEQARRMTDLEGCPRARMEGPAEFFERIEREASPSSREYSGELYFSQHRGSYTSQARTKRASRRAEVALREAELWAALASVIVGRAYPRAELDETWKTLLFNHFHDIVTGTSIRRVHEEAEAQLSLARAGAEALASAARADLAGPARNEGPAFGSSPLRAEEPAGTSRLRVYNSLSWTRTDLVELPASAGTAVLGHDGEALPTQLLEGRLLAELELPSCGYSELTLETSPPAPRGESSLGSAPRSLRPAKGRLSAGPCLLENELVRVELDERGALTSVYDKLGDREMAAGPCNDFRMYKDVPVSYDAWDIGSMYEQLPVELPKPASIELVAEGPLVAVLRVERSLAASSLVQDICLRRDLARVEFHSRIEWREDHKLLKVAFPLDLQCDEAMSEIQFGYLRRPTHKSRRYDADRYEVCQQRWTALAESRRGAAILNDCKYGVSVAGGCIALTLLKSAFVPDMAADRGSQEFSYALQIWNGSFADSGLPRAGYEFNVPPTLARLPFGYRSAAASDEGRGSFIGIDDPAVILESLKLAEDGSGDLVLRLYESLGSAARCAIELGFPVSAAVEADMLERELKPLEPDSGRIALDFRAFEIKTLRLRPFPFALGGA